MEPIVVIAIITLLMSLLVVFLPRVLDASRVKTAEGMIRTLSQAWPARRIG